METERTIIGGWRHGSMVKRPCCSYKGPRMSYQHLNGGSLPLIASVPGDLMPFFTTSGTRKANGRHTQIQTKQPHKPNKSEKQKSTVHVINQRAENGTKIDNLYSKEPREKEMRSKVIALKTPHHLQKVGPFQVLSSLCGKHFNLLIHFFSLNPIDFKK